MRPADESSGEAGAGWIDRWPARIAALLVVVLCAGILIWVHWKDLFPDPADAAQSDDPAAPCIAARHGQIDKMRGDGVIDDGQTALFKARAEALCRAQQGQGGPPPLPPE